LLPERETNRFKDMLVVGLALLLLRGAMDTEGRDDNVGRLAEEEDRAPLCASNSEVDADDAVRWFVMPAAGKWEQVRGLGSEYRTTEPVGDEGAVLEVEEAEAGSSTLRSGPCVIRRRSGRHRTKSAGRPRRLLSRVDTTSASSARALASCMERMIESVASKRARVE
jgi:hypothetical protein